MELLTTQLRPILRRLVRAPIFTAVTLLTIAVTIGATTAIFGVVESILLKPLPYTQPEELVSVKLTAPGIGQMDWSISQGEYFIFREQSRTFRDIGIYTAGGIKPGGRVVNVAGFGEPERVSALGVSDGLLPILGVTPFLGRSFTREDDSPDSPGTVILTYGYWNRKFGGDRSVIGRTIELDGKPCAIIGVLPEGFRFLDRYQTQVNPAVLVPLKLDRKKTYLGDWLYVGIVRLKPGVTLAQANADVDRMLTIVFRTFPPTPGFGLKLFEDMRLGPNLKPLKQDVVGDVGKVLWGLMGGISLVLFIACANLANLHLIRAEGRRQELAIRAALGASRGRIAAQLFFESLILALFGGLVGLGMAHGALRVLVAMAPRGLPRLHEIGVDGNVVLFTLAMSLAAGLLFGSFPVFKYAGEGFGIGLRAGGRSMSESRERRQSRGVLVIVQAALALILLVGSGLMIRTILALTSVNLGFSAPLSEVQAFSFGIREDHVKDPERVVRIEEEILHKIEAIQGVSSVALTRNVPMDGSGWQAPVYAKDRVYAPGEVFRARFEFVAPGFFKTLGVPLLAGRDFTWSETYNKVPVAIISEKFARKHWDSSANALGKQIRETQTGDWREVVGVVGSYQQDGAGREPPASVYWPVLTAHFQGAPDVRAQRYAMFVIRSARAGSSGLINEIRRAVWSVEPKLALADIFTLNDYYTKSMASTSFMLVMLTLAGSMELFLGIVGLYGVIAYLVSQRRREIGIRMALGAGKSEVLKMVISQGIKLALIGVAIGLAGALGLTRFLSSLLFGVKPNDPLTLVAASALFMAVAILASYIPARRATKVDPLEALKHE
jgi:putative ABC transport system permease protein